MNVVEPIIARSRAVPEAPAVVNAEGTLTYAELERAVSSTAQRFRATDIAPGGPSVHP